jgi:hypothetical protein
MAQEAAELKTKNELLSEELNDCLEEKAEVEKMAQEAAELKTKNELLSEELNDCLEEKAEVEKMAQEAAKLETENIRLSKELQDCIELKDENEINELIADFENLKVNNNSENNAAVKIQSLVRGRAARKKLEAKEEREEAAAGLIQLVYNIVNIKKRFKKESKEIKNEKEVLEDKITEIEKELNFLEFKDNPIRTYILPIIRKIKVYKGGKNEIFDTFYEYYTSNDYNNWDLFKYIYDNKLYNIQYLKDKLGDLMNSLYIWLKSNIDKIKKVITLKNEIEKLSLKKT